MGKVDFLVTLHLQRKTEESVSRDRDKDIFCTYGEIKKKG